MVNDNVVSLALKIAGGQKSDFTITKNSPEITSGSLTALLHTIPDKIDIEVTEVEVESENDDQAISLGKNDYNINIDYNINVPLEFENLRIFYNDTIEDLSSDLADITDKVKHLEISAVVDNAIPRGSHAFCRTSQRSRGNYIRHYVTRIRKNRSGSEWKRHDTIHSRKNHHQRRAR